MLLFFPPYKVHDEYQQPNKHRLHQISKWNYLSSFIHEKVHQNFPTQANQIKNEKLPETLVKQGTSCIHDPAIRIHSEGSQVSLLKGDSMPPAHSSNYPARESQEEQEKL